MICPFFSGPWAAALKNNTMNNLFIHFPPQNLQVSRPMLDKSFHRKVQSRKIFTHRESFETIIAKTEEKLSKVSLISKEPWWSKGNPQSHLTEQEFNFPLKFCSSRKHGPRNNTQYAYAVWAVPIARQMIFCPLCVCTFTLCCDYP